MYSRKQIEQVNTMNLNYSGLSSNDLSGKSQAKHKQFKLNIYGLNGDDEENDTGVQVKVTQETTVQQVIEQVSLFNRGYKYIRL